MSLPECRSLECVCQNEFMSVCLRGRKDSISAWAYVGGQERISEHPCVYLSVGGECV